MTSYHDNPVKIAVVGDIHNQWEAEDAIALQELGVDLVLFVGDFGNESVEVVRMIASVDLPKAAILGNHDAWYTASDWGRKRCPYDRDKEDWVQQQLDLLGDAHVGYRYLDFPEFQLSIVGSRPFSWGGDVWKNQEFYQERYGVNSFEESVERIVASAASATYETIIFVGHNGPSGLGNKAEDPCGRDWQPLGGDHGDPDFAEAIAQTQALGKKIPLVTFGHMHHTLRHTKEQLRTPIFTSPEGTVYLNAASFPRIIPTKSDSVSVTRSDSEVRASVGRSPALLQAADRIRNFSLVSLEAGVVSQASLVWVGQDYKIVSERLLYLPPEPVMQPV